LSPDRRLGGSPNLRETQDVPDFGYADFWDFSGLRQLYREMTPLGTPHLHPSDVLRKSLRSHSTV